MSVSKLPIQPENRAFQVRQDRHIIEDLDIKLRIDGQVYKIVNFSFFGIGVKVGQRDSFAEGEKIRASFLLDDIELQTVTGIVARKEAIEGGFLVALRTLDSAVDVERVLFFADAIRSLREHELITTKFSPLPNRLKSEVYGLRSKLEELKEKVDTLASNKVFPSFAQKTSFEEAVISTYAPFIQNLLFLTNKGLAATFEELPENQRPLAFDFYRSQLKHLIYESLFADRSLRKPRGYPGDYEMMNLIYRNEGVGRSLFARCMEQGIQLHNEPGAVRNRASYLKEKILETLKRHSGKIQILSAACGPAMEVKYAIQSMSPDDIKRTEFILLDQDEDALKDAEKNVRMGSKPGCVPNIRLVNESMKSLIVGAVKISDVHLVYSAGLFDYFTDAVATRAAQSLLAMVHKKGRLIIGNFNVMTTSWFAMLAIFDWHLVLRSKENMTEMFSMPGTGVKIESEPNDINLFSVIESIA